MNKKLEKTFLAAILFDIIINTKNDAFVSFYDDSLLINATLAMAYYSGSYNGD